MRFKQRKELADKYREWVKQTIDNNQTMILDCVESVIAFLDINGYLNNEVVRCKDCKHAEIQDYAPPSCRYCCKYSALYHAKNFYCSMGEMREE